MSKVQSVPNDYLSDQIERAARAILTIAEIDVSNDEFARTPERFVSFIETLLCRHTEEKPLMRVFDSPNNEMVIAGPIDWNSLCPHHLALVHGRAWVGYVPAGKVLGLSKIPRLVRWMAGSPIKQEDLTGQIAEELEKALFNEESLQGEQWNTHDGKPPTGAYGAYASGTFYRVRLTRSNGVAVVLDGMHTCMTARGIRVNSDCRVRTSRMTGCFLDSTKSARQEFLSLIKPL